MKRLFIRWWASLRIQYKLAFIFLLAIGIVALLSMAAIRIVSYFYETVLYRQTAGTLQLTSINIEKELERIELFSFTILQNRDIQQSLERIKNYSQTDRITDNTLAQEKKHLIDLLWVITFEKNVLSVTIIDNQGNQYTGGVSFPQSHIQEMIDLADKGGGALMLHNPVDEPGVLVCTRQIRKIDQLNLEPLGTLLIRVNLKKLVQESLAGVLNNMALVILSDNTPFFSSAAKFTDLAQKCVINNFRYGKINDSEGQSYFVTKEFSNQQAWTYVTFIEYEKLFKSLEAVNSLSIFILIFLIMISYVAIVRIGRNISMPLELLSAYAAHVERGDFSIPFIEEKVFIPHKDEIGQIEKDFILLLTKINDLIKENFAHELLIKDAQLRALQAQINPHFLYNTLDTIQWLARLQHQNEIATIAESLGFLLRTSISEKSQTITLKEELDLLAAYINIQKIRFGKKIDISITIDQKLVLYSIPKLTIQPIVENSIKYGIEETGRPCTIHIESEEKENSFFLHISDTGPGIDTIKEKKGAGIGLSNIHQRMVLLYGTIYGITIKPNEPSGTIVSIHLPKRSESSCTLS
jgi:two-component system sensor histidine kinase YesM